MSIPFQKVTEIFDFDKSYILSNLRDQFNQNIEVRNLVLELSKNYCDTYISESDLQNNRDFEVLDSHIMLSSGILNLVKYYATTTNDTIQNVITKVKKIAYILVPSVEFNNVLDVLESIEKLLELSSKPRANEEVLVEQPMRCSPVDRQSPFCYCQNCYESCEDYNGSLDFEDDDSFVANDDIRIQIDVSSNTSFSGYSVIDSTSESSETTSDTSESSDTSDSSESSEISSESSYESFSDKIRMIGKKGELIMYVIHPGNNFRVGDVIEFADNDCSVKLTIVDLPKQQDYKLVPSSNVYPPFTYGLCLQEPLSEDHNQSYPLNSQRITRYYPQVLIDSLGRNVLDSLSEPWYKYVDTFLCYAAEHSLTEMCMYLLDFPFNYINLESLIKYPQGLSFVSANPLWNNGNINEYQTALYWAIANGLTNVLEKMLTTHTSNIANTLKNTSQYNSLLLAGLKCKETKESTRLILLKFAKQNDLDILSELFSDSVTNEDELYDILENEKYWTYFKSSFVSNLPQKYRDIAFNHLMKKATTTTSY